MLHNYVFRLLGNECVDRWKNLLAHWHWLYVVDMCVRVYMFGDKDSWITPEGLGCNRVLGVTCPGACQRQKHPYSSFSSPSPPTTRADRLRMHRTLTGEDEGQHLLTVLGWAAVSISCCFCKLIAGTHANQRGAQAAGCFTGTTPIWKVK